MKNKPALNFSESDVMVESSNGVITSACSEQTNLNRPTRQLEDDMTWESLGISPGFSAEARYISVAFVGKIPYVAYIDSSNNNKISVKKLDATTNCWELVGNAHFSGNHSDYTDISFNGNVPYVVYADGEDFGKIKVKKLKDNIWETVGNIDFSGYCSSSSYIAFNNGNAYIVYQDGGNSNKITVRKYNAVHNKWDLLGEALPGICINNKLIFINNIPYLSYSENHNDCTSTIRRFNGSDWEVVGDEGILNAPSP